MAINNKNKRGPEFEPWGTPELGVYNGESKLLYVFSQTCKNFYQTVRKAKFYICFLNISENCVMAYLLFFTSCFYFLGIKTVKVSFQ